MKDSDVTSIGIMEVNDKVADYSWSRPAYQDLRNRGYKAVARYLPITPNNTSAKYFDAKELAEILKNGFGFVPIVEHSTSDVLGGYAKGNELGRLAATACKKFGIPDLVPTIATADMDITSSNIETAVAYFKGFYDGQKAISPNKTMGAYADTDVLNRIGALSMLNALPAAAGWSPNTATVPIHLRQTKQDSTLQYDNNITLANFYVMKETAIMPTPTPTPTPIKPNVNTPTALLVQIKGYSNVFLCGTGPITYVTPEMFNYYKSFIPFMVVDKNNQFMKNLFTATGLTLADLVAS